MHAIKTYLPPLGRLLMSSLFIWSGVGKLMNPAGTVKYFIGVHVPIPEVAVWVVIVIEVVGGLAILVGLKTRWAAAVLAVFTLITAFGVHYVAAMGIKVHDTATYMAHFEQMINFYKNLVITGGFLYIVAFGAGDISIDGPDRAT